MRISGPKDVAKTNKKSASGKAAGAGAHFVVGTAHPSGGLSGVQGAQAINNIGALLASQEVDEVQRARDGAVKQGNDMLILLDQLKLGVLNGRIAPQLLQQLRQRLADKERFHVGPELQSVLDQIELRAEVELAKMAQHRAKAR